MSATPPPNPTASGWTFGGVSWSVLVFILGTIVGWLAEDTLKPPLVRYFDSLAENYVPWDSPLVQRVWPSAITFEASDISGCSGGELERLVNQAKNQGLHFDNDALVAKTRLCQKWTYHGSAQSILRSMAIKFPDCFSIDQVGSFGVRLNARYICKTDYALNQSTNNWERTKDAVTLLCVPQAIKSRMSATEPYAHECPADQLKQFQFIR